MTLYQQIGAIPAAPNQPISGQQLLSHLRPRTCLLHWRCKTSAHRTRLLGPHSRAHRSSSRHQARRPVAAPMGRPRHSWRPSLGKGFCHSLPGLKRRPTRAPLNHWRPLAWMVPVWPKQWRRGFDRQVLQPMAPIRPQAGLRATHSTARTSHAPPTVPGLRRRWAPTLRRRSYMRVARCRAG